MSSVTASQTDWPATAFGATRRADAGRGRRTVAARDQPQPDDDGEPLPLQVGQPLLVGRATELGRIRSLLDDVADGGGALIVSGAQGVGKTTLLDAAERAAAARGIRVVRVDGAEFEADIDLAGLHQLLVPLSGEVRALPHHTRDAIEAALQLGIGPSPDRLVVLNAVFALLRHAARSIPLILVVDDVQWFDRASAEVLAFVARRLSGSHVGLLASVRVGSDSLLDRVGLPGLRLEPGVAALTANHRHRMLALTPDDDRTLLESRAVALGGAKSGPDRCTAGRSRRARTALHRSGRGCRCCPPAVDRGSPA